MPPTPLTTDNFVRFLTVKVPLFLRNWESPIEVSRILEIKIRVYAKRQKSDLSWEFLRIEK